MQVKTAASSATAVLEPEVDDDDDDDDDDAKVDDPARGDSALSFALCSAFSVTPSSRGRPGIAGALLLSQAASLRDLAANPRASLPRPRAREEGD